MRRDQDNALEALMEQLIESGPEEMASVFAGLFNFAMRIERERFLGAGHYERTPERRGYANGTRSKKIDTLAGTVTVEVPKTAGHEEPFYPQALERGRRSCRAVMLAVAEMYIKGVSTRDVEAMMREPMGLSVYELANAIKVPRSRANDIVRGRRAITTDTALRLGRYFGTTAAFWINLQARHDLDVADRSLRKKIEREVKPRAA